MGYDRSKWRCIHSAYVKGVCIFFYHSYNSLPKMMICESDVKLSDVKSNDAKLSDVKSNDEIWNDER